jgi:hypothetical protein
MKVQTPAVIAKVATMSDRTVRLNVDMPELPPDEMAILFNLYGKQGWFVFADREMTEEDLPTTQPPNLASGKTQSQLLRAVLYKIWELKPQGFDDFNNYYQFVMGELIGRYKAKLNELAGDCDERN